MINNEVLIKRSSVANWEFRYDHDPKAKHEASNILCVDCGIKLDGRYADIIFSLKYAGLLDNTFEPKCCSCFFITSYMPKRACTVCGDFLEADLQDGEIHIFCVSGCIEDHYEPNEKDAKYIKEYIEGAPDLINDSLRECGGILSDGDREYLRWLLDLQ